MTEKFRVNNNWIPVGVRLRAQDGLLVKCLLFALLPVLCCVIRAALSGHTIGDVYLPNSEWNDELFYYKQVENIVNFGYPQGYFGFNESHGLKLSFAAWSPVLIVPWILWGGLFGWNLLSPVLCNIMLMTFACLVFVWLARPTWKQWGILAALFCAYTPFTRYMMSVMPEIICMSHLIVFYGLALYYGRNCDTKGLERRGRAALIAMFVLAAYLTLMRPYLALFLLLPSFYWIRGARRRGKIWQGIVGSGAVCGGAVACYALIKHYFGAEYFAPLFFTDWITTFFTDGIGAGFHNLFGTLYYKGKDFCAHLIQGFRSGLASGAFFGGYLATMAILVWGSVADGRRKRGLRKAERQETGGDGAQSEESNIARLNAQLYAEAHLAFSFVAMLFALLLMYKLTEGSKHLLTFMAVGLFLVAMMDTKYFVKAILLGAVFLFFYTYRATEAYDYAVPYQTQEQAEDIAQWTTYFSENLELTTEDTPNYDNVVIWVYNEQSAETGETMKWQLLYALPEGYGISCCDSEYILTNFDSLQSRYLTAASGGDVDRMCAERGCTELARDEDIVLYELVQGEN